jgi:RHS repeat-associated protein
LPASQSALAAGSFGFGYDALSRRTSLTRPNGVNTSYSYDGLSHLLSVLHQAGTTVLDGAGYTYDPAGNRLSKANYLNGVTSNYSYDLLYELTQVTQGASTTESYTYDAVGNRLSSSGVPNYSYNSSNELTSNSNGSYTYDAAGNTLTDASGRSYTWDFENRLVQAVVPGQNGGTTTFKYDPFGRRIYKSSPTWTGGFVYDGPNLIETLNTSGVEVASYAQTQNIDETLAELRGSTTDYYATDGLGSTTSLSSSAGALANTYTYDSFGNTTALTGTVRNSFQYAGREFDPETGLYFNRARYFDPSAGRFLSQDPIRFTGGVNFYRYTRNNPVVRTDPSGYQGGCPPQSPNCVPVDPDSPYQGPDGLWYNTTEWNGQPDPTPPLPDSGPAPSPSPEKPGPLCDCDSNAEYWSRYFKILDEANDKRLTALWWTLGISGGNAVAEKGFEHWGAEVVGGVVAPVVEGLDLGHFTYENVEIDTEVDREVEALKRAMGCK